MSLIHFFFAFTGRISRQSWWLGLIVLMAISIPVGVLLDPEGLDLNATEIRSPSFAATLWSLATCWPTAAVTIKRLNDRDWPNWIGWLLVAMFVVLVIANYNGYLLDPARMSPPESMFFAALFVFFLWALIDNGFKKGTDGANRYGRDPLQQ